jgi:hypothetical protein
MDIVPWLIAGGVFIAFSVIVLRRWASRGNGGGDGGFYAADRHDHQDSDGGDGGGGD